MRKWSGDFICIAVIRVSMVRGYNCILTLPLSHADGSSQKMSNLLYTANGNCVQEYATDLGAYYHLSLQAMLRALCQMVCCLSHEVNPYTCKPSQSALIKYPTTHTMPSSFRFGSITLFQRLRLHPLKTDMCGNPRVWGYKECTYPP